MAPQTGLQNLAQAVKQRRAQLGLAQADLSSLGGPSIVTVSQIERGIIDKPQVGTLKRLDKALGWPAGTAASLVYGTDGVVPIGQDSTELDVNPDAVTDDELLVLIREERARYDALLEELERRLRER